MAKTGRCWRQFSLQLVMASVVLVSTGLAAWAASRFLSYLEVIGEATGVEFSPDVFKHRSFRYWTAAGFALPGTRRTYEWSSDLDTYLNTNGFVLAPPNRPTHWEFVRGFHPGRRGWMGGAHDTCHAFHCSGDGGKPWIVWTEANSELATILWPVVIHWMRHGYYYLAAHLLRDVEYNGFDSSEGLKKRIAELWRLSEIPGPPRLPLRIDLSSNECELSLKRIERDSDI